MRRRRAARLCATREVSMDHSDVLFWLFVSFFILIGVVSLLTVIGALTTDPRFRRWAVSGFIVGVAGAVFGLFKITFTEDVALFVALDPPQEERAGLLDLVSGQYKYYDEPTSSGVVKTHAGQAEMTLGPGGWQVK